MKIRVLRVFTNDRYEYGNPLGVVEDYNNIHDLDERVALASELGYSETLFLDDIGASKVSFYSPRREVPFAGHAAVGAAWVLNQLNGTTSDVLKTANGGDAPTWTTGNITWVRSALASTPPWWHERLSTPEMVDALVGPLSPEQDMTQLWAWVDETTGLVRVRTFASRAGISEDEACGSGAMRMAAALGRPLTLKHGRGSIIHAEPGPPGYADIGGWIAEDEPRTVHLHKPGVYH